MTFASTFKCVAAVNGTSHFSATEVKYDEESMFVKIYEFNGQEYQLESGTSGFYVNDKLLSFDNFSICAKRTENFCEPLGTTKLEVGNYLAVKDTVNHVGIACYVLE